MTKIIKMKNEQLQDDLVTFGNENGIEIVKRKDGVAIKNTFATEIQVVNEHIAELAVGDR